MPQFILHQKAYDFLLWLYPVINRLPKNYRHSLGRQLEQTGFSLLLYLIQANNSRGDTRAAYQKEASTALDVLHIFLRLTKDLHLISVKQYIEGSEKLNELGLMLSSWMKPAR